MNRQQFTDYIKFPDKLNATSAIQLENLVKEYPYCQTADILLALNLCKENHFKFNDQLRLASAYACDRKVLKELVNAIRLEGQLAAPIAKPRPEFKPHDKVSTAAHHEENNLTELLNQLKIEVNSIKTKSPDHLSSLINSRLDYLVKHLEALMNELEAPAESAPKTTHTPLPMMGEYNLDHLQELPSAKTSQLANNDLIDKFLEREPKIKPVSRPEFFDPIERARKSIIDNESVVSETLAEIYHKQGNLAKAIKIYKKLSLVNPEKSSYFAARIAKIEKEIKSD